MQFTWTNKHKRIHYTPITLDRSVYQVEDNFDLMASIPEDSVDFTYIDPPYNTGKDFTLRGKSFSDKWESDDAYLQFMYERLVEIHRITKGVTCVHVDYRVAHYIQMMMEEIWGKTPKAY